MANPEPVHKIISLIPDSYSRIDKEKFLRQRSFVLWMVGLSGSGKSTLARSVEKALHEKGYLTQLLDGDDLRTGINADLGFSENDREENTRRTAEIAKLFLNCGVITICALISPTNKIRALAKNIIGEDNFFEVFINCPLEECERRDVKGLYKLARSGQIKSFTGIDSPFEIPAHPSTTIDTHQTSIDECAEKLMGVIYDKYFNTGNRQES